MPERIPHTRVVGGDADCRGLPSGNWPHQVADPRWQHPHRMLGGARGTARTEIERVLRKGASPNRRRAA